MDLHEAALTDLLSLARRRGTLTMEDLQEALPVNSMTEQEIAHVLARLDEAGVDVEIDSTPLLPGNETATNEAAPIVKRDEMEVSEPMPGGRQRQASPSASGGTPAPQIDTAPDSNSVTSVSMLPWILAFAIVVLAVFAAFAF